MYMFYWEGEVLDLSEVVGFYNVIMQLFKEDSEELIDLFDVISIVYFLQLVLIKFIGKFGYVFLNVKLIVIEVIDMFELIVI